MEHKSTKACLLWQSIHILELWNFTKPKTMVWRAKKKVVIIAIILDFNTVVFGEEQLSGATLCAVLRSSIMSNVVRWDFIVSARISLDFFLLLYGYFCTYTVFLSQKTQHFSFPHISLQPHFVVYISFLHIDPSALLTCHVLSAAFPQSSQSVTPIPRETKSITEVSTWAKERRKRVTKCTRVVAVCAFSLVTSETKVAMVAKVAWSFPHPVTSVRRNACLSSYAVPAVVLFKQNRDVSTTDFIKTPRYHIS